MNLFSSESESPTGMERTAALAVRLASRRVSDHDSRFSRKDFTRPQLLACVLLRAAYGLTYREIAELLSLSPALREVIGLRRTPHFTTIESHANADGMDELVQTLLDELMLVIGDGRTPTVPDVAMDSTGLGITGASAYFEEARQKKRSGRKPPRSPGVSEAAHQRRHNAMFVKVSVIVLCGSLLPAAVKASMGRSNDNAQSHQLVEQMSRRVRVSTLYADAGYDGEPLHRRCRERHGIRSFIPAVSHAPDGQVKTPYRSQMTSMPAEYARRKHVESFFSALKRTTGPTLGARRPDRQLREAVLRVLAYGIRRTPHPHTP